MFKTASGATEIADEDAAYWNVAAGSEADDAELKLGAAANIETDSLVALAVELGGVVTPKISNVEMPHPKAEVRLESVEAYLDRVHILSDKQWTKLKAYLLSVLAEGTDEVIGMRDSAFLSYPTHEEALTAWLTNWLRTERVVFTGCEAEVAAQIIGRTKAAFEAAPALEPVIPSGASTSQVPSPLFTLQRGEAPARRTKPAPHLAAAAKGDELPQQLALF